VNSAGFSQENNLHISSSGLMLCFIIATHTLAVISIFLSGLGVGMMAFTTLAVICHSCHVYSEHYLLQGRKSVRHIHLSDTNCLLTLTDSREVNVNLVGEVVVLEWIVCLKFLDPIQGNIYAAVLFNDAVAFDDFRRLRVWLKLNARHAVAT
jgi:hypothetical protein